MIKKFELQKGNTIPAKFNLYWKVLKVTECQIKIGMSGKSLTFKWDDIGYKRQGQYLYKDGIK